MQVTVSLIGTALIVKLNGEIDHHSSKTIKETIDNEYSAQNAKNIIIDFTNVSFMDSSGIGMIMGRYKKLVPRGEIKIFGVNDNIKRIFDISGLHKIITIHESLQAATGGAYVR